MKFLKYEKIHVGLLFVGDAEAEYPTDLAGYYDDRIVGALEDFLGRLRIETERHVYLQEGFREMFCEKP